MISRSRISLGLILLLGLSPAVLGQAKTPPKPKVFVGYVFGETASVDCSLYTHLCDAFLPGPGKVRGRQRVPDIDLVRKAHAAGVKVQVSLGGWGWDEQFAALGKGREEEDRYVRRVMGVVDMNDYDGIDLDWEYPDAAEEVVTFERLARRFRKELDTLAVKKDRPMLLTMAASSNTPTLRWLDTAFLVETMDWINVMTYDYTGPWTDHAGHHAPLHASKKQPGPQRSLEDTVNFLVNDRKLPADRVVLGLPLYGWGFAVAAPYASTKNGRRDAPAEVNYKDILPLMSQGWSRQWDDETSTPWLIAPHTPTVIAYDDERSIALKTDWALARGLRGVFFWQVNGDALPNGTHPLQSAARKRFDSARPK